MPLLLSSCFFLSVCRVGDVVHSIDHDLNADIAADYGQLGMSDTVIMGAFREGPGAIPEAPEALPDQIFFKNFTILFCWFLRFFFAGCVPILSGFVGFRRDVAGIRIQTQ